MAEEERRKPLKMADLNGYVVSAVPAVLPPSTIRPKSGMADVREHFPELWADEEFRELMGSLTNGDAVTGNYHADKVLAAQKVITLANNHGLTNITSLGKKAIGKLAREWLPKAMAERHLDRQSRLRQAIADGRAAEVAEHAAEDQV